MPGKRQPIAVLEARGKKHLTKKETAQRKETEVAVVAPAEGEGSKVRAPEWLPNYLRDEFNDLRAQLVAAGIFAKLDRDVLGYYLVARRQYTAAAQKTMDCLDQEDSESAAKWANLQDKFFKQARACANDMGLTITSRCRLVVPEREKQEENPFERLIRERMNSA